MSVSIDDQKLLLVIINEYSQDNFPKLPNNYFLLEMTDSSFGKATMK